MSHILDLGGCIMGVVESDMISRMVYLWEYLVYEYMVVYILYILRIELIFLFPFSVLGFGLLYIPMYSCINYTIEYIDSSEILHGIRAETLGLALFVRSSLCGSTKSRQLLVSSLKSWLSILGLNTIARAFVSLSFWFRNSTPIVVRHLYSIKA